MGLAEWIIDEKEISFMHLFCSLGLLVVRYHWIEDNLRT